MNHFFKRDLTEVHKIMENSYPPTSHRNSEKHLVLRAQCIFILSGYNDRKSFHSWDIFSQMLRALELFEKSWPVPLAIIAKPKTLSLYRKIASLSQISHHLVRIRPNYMKGQAYFYKEKKDCFHESTFMTWSIQHLIE